MLTDELAPLEQVHLRSFEPHALARDSIVAQVEVDDKAAEVGLRAVAEHIFRQSGILVLFRSSATPHG